MSTTTTLPRQRTGDTMDEQYDAIRLGRRVRSTVATVLLATAVGGAALTFSILQGHAQHAEHARQAACTAAQADTAALLAGNDREAARLEFVTEAQEMLDAQAEVPGATYEHAAAGWDATYQSQRTQDDYQRVLLSRIQANTKVCAR